MTQTSVRPRTLPVLFLTLSVLGGVVFIPQPAQADVSDTCGKTILVLDESGSVSPHEANVRNAVDAFLTPLVDSGVEAGIVEFGSAAKTVFGYTMIDGANLAFTFSPYLNATSGGDIYDAPSQLGPYTNWDDALDEVTQINSSEVAALVLFLTDGDPTAYNLDKPGEAGGVHINGVSAEGLNRAIEEADEIRSQGSHLIAVGVGSGLTNAASIDRLKQVAGPDVYDGSGSLDLDATDVVLVSEFGDLPEVMALIAAAMCADPAISVEKTASSSVVIAGTDVTYQIDVTNTGNVNLHYVILDDPLVPDCSEDIGDLAVGETVTVECTTTVWEPLTNTATATGTDPSGTPVQDDGSATTTLIDRGTGTPGYWRNHLDMWPIANDTVLIGDWNHNWACDGDETCLELTKEEALMALTTPPRGDMTWNLGRPLVAAWLNVSAGNDSSCIADTVDSAAAWLQSHPLGSGVGGSDPAWVEASGWATLLDDYNNGKLCAEHRDANGDADEDTAEATVENIEASQEQEQEQEQEAEPGDDWDGSGGNPPPHASKGKNGKN